MFKKNNIVKKLFCVALIASFSFCSIAPAYAAGNDSSNSNNVKVMYNGTNISFVGAVPQNINGSVYAPFRKTMEEAGATVAYNDQSRTATISKKDTILTYTIGSTLLKVTQSGVTKEKNLNMPYPIENDSLLVPVRLFSESFGLKVDWDDHEKTVVITDFDKYVEKFLENNKNIIKLAEVSKPSVDAVKTDSQINYSVSVKSENPPEDMQDLKDGRIVASITISDTTITKEQLGKMGVVISLDDTKLASALVSSFNKSANDNKLSMDMLKNITLDMMADKDNLYIRSNLASLFVPKDSKIELFSKIVDVNKTWFKINTGKLNSRFEKVLKSAALSTITSGDMSAKNNLLLDIRALFEAINFDSGMGKFANQVFTFYSEVLSDRHLNIDRQSDDSYKVAYALDKDSLFEALRAFDIPQSVIDEFSDMFKYDLSINATIKNGLTHSALLYTYSYNSESTFIEFHIDSNVVQTPATPAQQSDVKMPTTDVVDVTDMLIEAI